MRSVLWRFASGKRVAFPWSKPLETARSLFSKSIPSEYITSSERQCWLLDRFGLRFELLVEVLRIDVQLLLGLLLRLGGGLGDLVFQAGFADDDECRRPCIEVLAEVLHVRARHAVPDVAD